MMNKLSEEQAEKIEESNHMSQQLFLSQPYLKFKVNKVNADLAMSVIYSLIMNVVIPFNQPEEKAGLWDMPENIIRP